MAIITEVYRDSQAGTVIVCEHGGEFQEGDVIRVYDDIFNGTTCKIQKVVKHHPFSRTSLFLDKIDEDIRAGMRFIKIPDEVNENSKTQLFLKTEIIDILPDNRGLRLVCSIADKYNFKVGDSILIHVNSDKVIECVIRGMEEIETPLRGDAKELTLDVRLKNPAEKHTIQLQQGMMIIKRADGAENKVKTVDNVIVELENKIKNDEEYLIEIGESIADLRAREELVEKNIKFLTHIKDSLLGKHSGCQATCIIHEDDRDCPLCRSMED